MARLYRWAEYASLGPLLQRTRVQLLGRVSSSRQALVLGDGDGRFLEALLRSNAEVSVLALDASAEMLRLLKRRCAFADRRVSTQRHLIGPLPKDLNLSQTDLVVSHFFLDCFSEAQVEALAVQLASRLAPGTLWLLSDFAYVEKRPWRTMSRLYIHLLYLAFRMLTGLSVRELPQIATALSQAGFVRLERAERLAGLLYSELWCLAG